MRRTGPAAAAALLTIAMLAVSTSAQASALELAPDHGIGLFDPHVARWYLHDGHDAVVSFDFGDPGDIPLVGDWDGDGVDTPAVYDPETGWVTLRNWTTEPPTSVAWRPHGGWLGIADHGAELALPDLHRLPSHATPVVADPDGDGIDAISVAVGNRLYVLSELPGRVAPEIPPATEGADPGLEIPNGANGVVAGDYDGDGRDEFAARVGRRLVGLGDAMLQVNVTVGFGTLISGDWNDDGRETPGSYNSVDASFHFLDAATGAPSNSTVDMGSTGMVGLAGRFGDLRGEPDPPPRIVGLPAMEIGDEGREVAVLQAELKRRGLYRGPIDGQYGLETGYAVMAFHKTLGLERVYEWKWDDARHLAEFELPPLPERPDEPARVEVDIGRQVLFIFENHEVNAIVPVSTGGSYTYYSPRNDAVVAAGTPRGDFTLFHSARGWHCDPLTGWCIYNPWSFTPYYALHGYLSVPEYPASHGCVRITTWDSDILTDDYLFVGIPIHIWDTYDPEDGGADA